MSKTIDVYGIGNAIVDMLVEIDEESFQSLGIQKASMGLVEHSEQEELLAKFFNHKPIMASGGSVANSIISISQLGGQAALSSSIGDDDHGKFYFEECKQIGIEMPNGPQAGKFLLRVEAGMEKW